MKAIHLLWAEFSRNQNHSLALACAEMLEFKKTGIVPEQGIIRAFAEQLRVEGYPGYQTLTMSCDTISHFAIEWVASQAATTSSGSGGLAGWEWERVRPSKVAG